MKNLKIINKIATYFGISSIIFVALTAIITFYLLQIASPTAPTEYVVFYVLSSILPYLFIAVLSMVIAALSKGAEKEVQPPAAQPSE